MLGLGPPTATQHSPQVNDLIDVVIEASFILPICVNQVLVQVRNFLTPKPSGRQRIINKHIFDIQANFSVPECDVEVLEI